MGAGTCALKEESFQSDLKGFLSPRVMTRAPVGESAMSPWRIHHPRASRRALARAEGDRRGHRLSSEAPKCAIGTPRNSLEAAVRGWDGERPAVGPAETHCSAHRASARARPQGSGAPRREGRLRSGKTTAQPVGWSPRGLWASQARRRRFGGSLRWRVPVCPRMCAHSQATQELASRCHVSVSVDLSRRLCTLWHKRAAAYSVHIHECSLPTGRC